MIKRMRKKKITIKCPRSLCRPLWFSSTKMMRLSFSFLFLILAWASLQAQDTADGLFDQPKIFNVSFTFADSAFLDTLYQSHQDGEYRPASVTIDGLYFGKVGVRFKGTSSFYGYPGDKKALRVKFSAFADYNFYGLKKINLNNCWSDPSFLREKLYLDFLREQGIAAPRANFARVYLNGVYWGLYTLVEHVDKTFLKSRFGNNDGNLFKAEKQADLSWQGNDQQSYYDNYALQTNEKENDWSDLLALIDTINHSTDAQLENALASILNTQGFLRVWAANNVFMNLDSYLGSANNFYMYHNESKGVFDWIIWDVNLAFGARTSRDTLDLFYKEEERPLLRRLLKNETYRRAYLQEVERLAAGLDEALLFPKIDALFGLIKKDYQADTLKMYSNAQVLQSLDEAVGSTPGLKPFIRHRAADIEQRLDEIVSGLTRGAVTPLTAELHANYPNPFNPATRIPFELRHSGHVKLEIFDAGGRRISTLVNAQRPAGTHRVVFDGRPLSSGVYFYRLTTERHAVTRKMLLVK